VADVILDRLIHNAHRIKQDGESIRKNRGMKKDSLSPSRQAEQRFPNRGEKPKKGDVVPKRDSDQGKVVVKNTGFA
jgi:hypothetical protein